MADAPSPSVVFVDFLCRVIQPVTVDDVVAAVYALPDNSCALDPLLTPLSMSLHQDDTVQLTAVDGSGPSCVPGCTHHIHAPPEKSGHGSCRRPLILTCFEFDGCIEASGAPCCMVTTAVLRYVRPPSTAPVCLSCRPLSGDCHVECFDGHPA